MLFVRILSPVEIIASPIMIAAEMLKPNTKAIKLALIEAWKKEVRARGSALLKQLAKIALKKKCERMKWTVLDCNKPSHKFYYALGAKSMDEWTTFRLTSKELQELVKE